MGLSTTESGFHQDLRAILAAGLDAVNPRRCVENAVSLSDERLQVVGTDRVGCEVDLQTTSRIVAVAVGKAAPGMMAGLAGILADRLTRAMVVTGTPTDVVMPSVCTVLQAGHPVPDRAGLTAGQAVAGLARNCGPDDLFMVLLSGGASAMLPAPVEGLSLADKQKVTRGLLVAGATIAEVNCVRTHLSYLKGGGLAGLAHPGRVITLAISDVIGDDPAVIGSGPTVPATTVPADAKAVLHKYGLWQQVAKAVRTVISRSVLHYTPAFERPEFFRIAGNCTCLDACADKARSLNYLPVELVEHPVSGEARLAGDLLARNLLAMKSAPGTAGACRVSGGETTVTVTGTGAGGRNLELALAAAITLSGARDVALLSAGTDGVDGTTTAAGAIVDGGTVARAAARGLVAQDFLKRNDSYSFFAGLEEVLQTGPTGTNVMDVQLLVSKLTTPDPCDNSE
jgi:glycerate 2-kinase